ncbi:MAG: LPXTG cell wall anchor domain-containing protein, partial [Solibacillus sp.]
PTDPPTKPGEPTDPSNPPTKPGEPTDSTDLPTKPGNLGTKTPPTLPGLEEVIKPIPPSILPTPKDPLTPGELDELIEEYSKDPSKLDALVNELKDLLNYYDSLSPEQKAEFEDLYDVNGLNKLKEELEKVATLQAQDQKQAQDKLPQTDGASQFGTMLAGLALLLAGAWLVVTRRRKA